MANFSFVSMAPELAAIADQITTVDTVVDNIRAVDVVNLAAQNTVIDGIVDDILVDTDTTLPAEHIALAIEHGVIDGIVDDILVDTDATIPAAITAKKIRGDLIVYAGYSGVPGDVNYHDALNLTNETGKLVKVQCMCLNTSANLRITIDGNAIVIPIAFGAFYDLDFDISTAGNYRFVTSAKKGNLNLEFGTSLRLEIKQTNGANSMTCQGQYISDT